MNSKLVFLPLLACGLVLAGCGKNGGSAASAPAASAPASETANAVVSVDLTANDSMKYSLNRIEAKPGQEIKVTFTNTGTMPKQAMAHNFIVLKKGVDPKEFVNAALGAVATDYIPASMADKIIAHTKLLGPKQSDEITFNAPTEPGEYTFLCSFPAHFLTGMHGVLVVQ
jgi:azurin